MSMLVISKLGKLDRFVDVSLDTADVVGFLSWQIELKTCVELKTRADDLYVARASMPVINRSISEIKFRKRNWSKGPVCETSLTPTNTGIITAKNYVILLYLGMTGIVT